MRTYADAGPSSGASRRRTTTSRPAARPTRRCLIPNSGENARGLGHFLLRMGGQQLAFQHSYANDLSRTVALLEQTSPARTPEIATPGWPERLVGCSLRESAGTAIPLYPGALKNQGRFDPGWLPRPCAGMGNLPVEARAAVHQPQTPAPLRLAVGGHSRRQDRHAPAAVGHLDPATKMRAARTCSGTAGIVTLWRNCAADINDTDPPRPAPAPEGHRADADAGPMDPPFSPPRQATGSSLRPAGSPASPSHTRPTTPIPPT
jgi:hypothetical protein